MQPITKSTQRAKMETDTMDIVLQVLLAVGCSALEILSKTCFMERDIVLACHFRIQATWSAGLGRGFSNPRRFGVFC
jgi:hypothetical protein